jgi:hypothetical protein
MTRIVLAFDDEDEHMGEFNRGCLDDLNEFLVDSKYQVFIIQSAQLNDLNIHYKTEGDFPFLFAAYSHGLNNSLQSQSGTYVSTTTNHTHFNQAVFYTVSCHAAVELGPCLIENGCVSFFGYKSIFNFWVGYKCFSQCANHGLFLFLNGTNTDEVYQQMIAEYNSQIDALYEDDSFVASLLLENRKALVYNERNVTIEELVS